MDCFSVRGVVCLNIWPILDTTSLKPKENTKEKTQADTRDLNGALSLNLKSLCK